MIATITRSGLRPGGRLRPVVIVAGIAIVVWIRWAVVVDAALPPLVTGVVFGLALAAIGLVGGARRWHARRSAVAVGIGGGLALVGLALGSRIVSGAALPFAPTTAFLPWAGVTILVAGAEELVLRGALFDAVGDEFGDGAAVVVASVVFALMHVPLYGWHVVPLDLGVGLWLGGLRLVSGGVVAPGTAHAIADLAAWWL